MLGDLYLIMVRNFNSTFLILLPLHFAAGAGDGNPDDGALPELRLQAYLSLHEPYHLLTDGQAEIFDVIVKHCVAAGILSSVDDIALAQFCVAVDRLRTIEMMVNRDNGYLFDSKLMSTRAGYEKTMWRGCNEFCLSPQARAKIGSLAVGKAKDATDPLAEALST